MPSSSAAPARSASWWCSTTSLSPPARAYWWVSWRGCGAWLYGDESVGISLERDKSGYPCADSTRLGVAVAERVKRGGHERADAQPGLGCTGARDSGG